MERLQHVLGRRAEELVELMVMERGFGVHTAERFVAVAATDLIGSYEWQAEELDLDDLSAPTNVRSLLAGIRANAVASMVGIPTSEAWEGLRTFVPRVLRMAASEETDTGVATPERRSWTGRTHTPRRHHVSLQGER